MVGTKFYKPVEDWTEYTQAAAWCNNNFGHHIEDKGEYYEIVVDPLPNLDELKQTKLDELNSAFNERVSGSFTTTQSYLMQFDTSDSIKMQGAITLMEAVGSTVGYITQANDVTVYNVPIAIMKQVLVEMLNAYAQCHARKQELRALINNVQTKEELDEIVISWPL